MIMGHSSQCSKPAGYRESSHELLELAQLLLLVGLPELIMQAAPRRGYLLSSLC